MKKLREALDKYIVHLIFTVIVFMGIALWDYATRFFSVPDRMDQMEYRLIHDSIMLVKIKDDILKEQKDHRDSISSHRKLLNQHEADALFFYKKLNP